MKTILIIAAVWSILTLIFLRLWHNFVTRNQSKTMNENNNYQAAADRELLEEHEAHPERFTRVDISALPSQKCEDNGWHCYPPQRPGKYLCAFGETDYEETPVDVVLKDDVLWATLDGEFRPLQMWHDGLTDMWWGPCVEDKPTKADIEATSNLIRASKLLGGIYREDGHWRVIDLPCGRSVKFEERPGLEHNWSLTPSWKKCGRCGIIRCDAPAETLARFIRAAVVKNDEEIS